MKKYITLLIVSVIAITSIFAQTAADATEDLDGSKNSTIVKTIVPDNQHTTNKTAKVSIEYIPLTDEVTVYFTCMDVSFDQGEAMNTIYACLEDFQKENQYYGYKFLKKDAVKYYKDARNVKMVEYSSKVLMTR